MLIVTQDSCKKSSSENDSNSPETAGTVHDIDGNVYHSVTIGTQVWMVENLKTTRFSDGSSIPYVGGSWNELITPAYCWYDNDETNKTTYGALYNWFAVHTLKLSPVGWHVPTESEWDILINYLGGDSIAGGSMKEAGTTHWMSPNTGANNGSGFFAFPGGYHTNDFGSIREFGSWWSRTSIANHTAFALKLYFSSKAIYSTDYSQNNGYSVRCVKD